MGATLLPCDVKAGQLDVASVLHQLGAQGLTRIFCEGGGALAASLLQADLVDQLVGFTAGVVIGADGLAGIGNAGVTRLAQVPRFELTEARTIGPDVLHIWRRP